MKQSDLEIITNPFFVIGALVFLVLSLIYRSYRWKQSEKEKEKVGAFMFGVIPLKDGFFNYTNKKHLVGWALLLIIFLVPAIIGVVTLIKEPQSLRKVLPALLFPLILVAVWIQGKAYKKAKQEREHKPKKSGLI